MRVVVLFLAFAGALVVYNPAFATVMLVMDGSSGASVEVSGTERLNVATDGLTKITNAIVIGESTKTCDATTEGAIRYNSTDKKIDVCDGSSWQ